MDSNNLSEILKLNVAERIQLVEDIWDSIASIPESIELTLDQRKELERRLALYRQNPIEGTPWGVLREQLVSFQ